MERRKIQLIAGATYTVSLPKDWVRKSGLMEKSEVSIHEREDRSLIIMPSHSMEKKKDIYEIKVEEHGNTLKQVLYCLYYLGIEEIQLVSEKKFSKEARALIRKGITRMSGTEITYEDEHKLR